MAKHKKKSTNKIELLNVGQKLFGMGLVTEENSMLLDEIMSFNLGDDLVLDNAIERLATSSFYQSKLSRINLSVLFMLSEMINEFEKYCATQIHEVTMDYDGKEALLKTLKDYERELYRYDDYQTFKEDIAYLTAVKEALKGKIDEFAQNQWIIKNFIDLEKLRRGI